MSVEFLEHNSEPKLPGMVDVIPVVHRYKLLPETERVLRETPYEFGFDGFSESVFYRTYSRLKPDGSKERFNDTVIRCVEGIFSILIDWNEKHGLKWPETEVNGLALRMGRAMLKMQFLPPGRGLWTNGCDYTYNRGSLALNNCGFISLNEGLVKAATWTMDALMCGAGIGFDTRATDEFSRITIPGCSYCRSLNNQENFKTPDDAYRFNNYHKSSHMNGCNCNKTVYKIHDSREGWVYSVYLLLSSYFGGKIVFFDYTGLRKEGEHIHGFGGKSSGPEPLRILHHRIRCFMECFVAVRDGLKSTNDATHDMILKLASIYPETNYYERASLLSAAEKIKSIHGKSYGTSRLICDIFNAIGICIVAGNIRRSSEIALGYPYDSEFLNMKNYTLNPEREILGWMSNNTVILEKTSDFDHIDEISERIKDNGEPGIFNMINAKRYGRYGRHEPIGREAEEDSRAMGVNPCITGDSLVLTKDGEIKVEDLVGKQFSVRVAGGIHKSTEKGFWSNGVKPVYRMTLENGFYIKATKNHKFLVADLRTGKSEWVELGNITDFENQKVFCKDDYLFNVSSIQYEGEYEVYDCTIPGPSCYIANGIYSHNCSEQILESQEICNLSEVFPKRCNNDIKKLEEAVFLATLYASIVSLLPTHWATTNAIISRNRRIGVSFSGITEFLHSVGSANMTKYLRILYKVARKTNFDFAGRVGVNPAIRITTVKPSGTISQLAGVPCGIHFNTFRYCIRRMRISANSELVKVLHRAGYHSEPDLMAGEGTLVFSYPLDNGESRTAEEVTMWEQAMLQAMLQREWSDNAVSCTVYFNPDRESSELKYMLAQLLPIVKSVSLLPHTPSGKYKQAPYEKISEQEYLAMKANIKPIQWNDYSEDGIGTNQNDEQTSEIKTEKKEEDSEMSRGCDGDTCNIAAYKMMLEDLEKNKEKKESKKRLRTTEQDSEMSRGCDGDACDIATYKRMMEDSKRRKEI